VHRNTVLAAYRELDSEGFLQSQAGRGTFVANTLPEVKPRHWLAGRRRRAQPAPECPGFPFEPPATPDPYSPPPPGALALYGGLGDTRLVPRAALARAYRRALRGPTDLLGYGDPRGEPRLRAALASMLRSTRGLAVSEDDVLVTRGSQMALALLARVLLRPGDGVAVEALGYQPAWRALAQQGARLLPVPIDGQGLCVDALSELCNREQVRAVYVTPHHQYPSTVTMSAARRMALLELARERRLALVEDDYDHEFHYEGRPVLPLASADDASLVLYVGTLSKVLAPGLRVGYLVAPEPVRQAALAARFDLDRQGDRVGEQALAELFEDGELQRHLWRARRIYRARRDHLLGELEQKLAPWFEFDTPAGGIALWVRTRGLSVAGLHESAARRGVLFQPGKLFSFDGRAMARLRLGYGALNEREMTRAVSALRAAAVENSR
jgi:GntR family transcriptional regulator/MocR family aminotransferase